jgi:hypothetical protein
MDNLNTHKPGSLYEAFPPDKAKALWDRFEFVYTPKHGSWVNVTENHRENRMHRIHFGIKHPLSHLLALFSSSRTRPQSG